MVSHNLLEFKSILGGWVHKNQMSLSHRGWVQGVFIRGADEDRLGYTHLGRWCHVHRRVAWRQGVSYLWFCCCLNIVLFLTICLHPLQLHGKGTLQHRSGAYYDGEFEDNMYHGTGTYTFPDGCTYKGQFYKNRYSFKEKKMLTISFLFHFSLGNGQCFLLHFAFV